MMGSRLNGLGAIEANSLCSREFIFPIEFGIRRSPEACGLGRFFEVTDDQAARLIEIGIANRQAAGSEQPAQPESSAAAPE